MSKATVLKIKEFDVNNVHFSPPKTTTHGSTVIYPNYHNPKIGRTHKLRLQLPKMPVPGGIQKYDQTDKQGRVVGTRYSFFMSFANTDTNQRRKMALEKFRALDEAVINALVENSKLWLKQPGVTKEVAKMLYKCCVKISKDKDTGEPDGKYPDSIKVNIPSNDQGEIVAAAYDEAQNRVNLATYMEKGSSVIPILECNGLWVVGSQLHLSWKVVNIQVFPSDQIRGFAILSDSEGEEDATTTTTTTTATATEPDAASEQPAVEPMEAPDPTETLDDDNDDDE